MRRLGAILVACACSLIVTAAQEGTRPSGPEQLLRVRRVQAPVYRLTTRLVEVAVIVRKDGSPVPGLSAADFRLFDNGKEEPIEFFRVESDEPVGASPLERTSPPPAAEFSNRLAGRPHGVTVILFDRLNTRFEDQVMARDQILGFLRQLEPDDRVALYVLESNAIRVVHDLGGDTRSLVRALRRLDGTAARAPGTLDEQPLPAPQTGDRTLDAEIEAWLLEATRRVSTEFLRRRSQSTLGALEAIAGRLSGVMGRKNLLWVSSAFPLVYSDQGFVQTSSDALRRATTAINNANIAIYPIDARGLIGAFTPQSPTRGPTFVTGATIRPSVDTMQTLAASTGGRAFYNTNDITGSIRRAIDDGRATYVLGYYPSHDRWDGSFHELKVKLSRPGVELRHRKGYLALPTEADDRASREGALQAAARSPLQATGIGLTVRIDESAGPGEGVPLVIAIDPRGLTILLDDDRWRGAIDLLVGQSLPGGTFATSAYLTFNLHLTAEQRDQVQREGLVFRRRFELTEQAVQLRVVATDVPTGTTGSVVIPVETLRAALKP